eukprot:m.94718 g.94718  ORF g.94718 m.94718 type:complete len:359 (+) comp8580_c0_seq1:10-1086(+)
MEDLISSLPFSADTAAKLRAQLTQPESPWATAGQEPGVEIWRINGVLLAPVARRDQGSFYADNTYVLLKTAGSPPHQIFYWIGAGASEEDTNIAALRAAELEMFKKLPVILHRELQQHESAAFKTLFPFITYLDGGETQSFHPRASSAHIPRLLRVSCDWGRVVLTEVPRAAASLNEGQSFIHDGGMLLIVWHGKKTNMLDKHKACTVVHQICTLRGGLCKREVLEQGITNESEWWRLLGGKGPVGPVVVPEATPPHGVRRLMRVAVDAESSRVELHEVAMGPSVTRGLLKSDDLFILDDGHEVYVWLGANVNSAWGPRALSLGIEYVRATGRASTTPIARMLEGAESTSFLNTFRAS